MTNYKKGKSFEVFPDEMNLMVKFMNLAMNTPGLIEKFDIDEQSNIHSFMDDFKEMTLNWGN